VITRETKIISAFYFSNKTLKLFQNYFKIILFYM